MNNITKDTEMFMNKISKLIPLTCQKKSKIDNQADIKYFKFSIFEKIIGNLSKFTRPRNTDVSCKNREDKQFARWCQILENTDRKENNL